jgi:hypothetical protein
LGYCHESSESVNLTAPLCQYGRHSQKVHSLVLGFFKQRPGMVGGTLRHLRSLRLLASRRRSPPGRTSSLTSSALEEDDPQEPCLVGQQRAVSAESLDGLDRRWVLGEHGGGDRLVLVPGEEVEQPAEA